MTVRTIDTSLNRTLTLDSWSRNLTSISNQFIRMLLLDVEGYFLYTNFVSISQRIFWQNICFWCFIWHHAWFSRSDFDNLRYGSQGFFIRKFLTVNNLTIGTVDTSLDSSFALDTRSHDLAGISNKLIGILLLDVERNFLYTGFVSISQWILWQSLCFRRFARYHGWFSCTNFDNLRYWSQGFLIRQFLAVDHLAIRTVDSGLNDTFALDTWSYDLTTSFWNLICILLVNRKINLFYSNLIICSQFQLRILMNRSCIRICTIFCQFWNLLNWRCIRTGAILCQFWNFVNWCCFWTGAIFRQFWNLLNWSCLGTSAILCQFWNFMNWCCFWSCPIFRQFWNFMNWGCIRICTVFRQFWNFVNWCCFWSCAIFCQFWNFVNWSFFWYRVSWSCSN